MEATRTQSQPRLYLKNDRLFLTFPYEDRNAAKAIEGYRWDRLEGAWSYPLSYFAVLRLLRVFKHAVEIQQDVLDYARAALSSQKRLDAIRQGQHLEGAPQYLYRHQKIALEIAKETPRFGLYMDVGTGKTATSIEIIRHWKAKDGLPWLVLCPLSIIGPAWLEDLAKFGNGLRGVSLWAATRGKRVNQLSQEADIYITNYEGFKLLLPEIQQRRWGGMVVDEASKIKAPSSAITKAVMDMGRRVPRVYLLSGTPAPNSALEYYPQMKALDEGMFGSFSAFKNRYFHRVGYGGFKLILRLDSRDELMGLVQKRAIFFRKEECLDLPEQIFTHRSIELDYNSRRIYDQMKREAILEWEAGGETVAQSVVVKLMKLRQITSGFSIDSDGKEHDIHDAKYQEIQAILDEIGEEQVVVMVQFRHEIERLRKIHGEGAVYIYGDASVDERNEGIAAFRSGQKRILVGHPRSMAHGLTLTNASYLIWLSMSYSLEEWLQANARIHRIGQSRACNYISVIAKGTVDEEIYRAVSKKKVVSDALLDMIKGESNGA